MKWSDLTMKEKAAIMKVAVDSGIYNISTIKNRFDTGGPKDKVYIGRTDRDYYGNVTHSVSTRTDGDELLLGLPDIVVTPKDNLLLASRNYDENIARNVADVVSFIPGVGEVIDTTTAAIDASRGDYSTAAGLGLGILIPNVLEKPIKSLWRRGKRLIKGTQKNTIKDDIDWPELLTSKPDPMSTEAKPVSNKIFIDETKVSGLSSTRKPRYLDYGTVPLEDNLIGTRPKWVKNALEFYDTDVRVRERDFASDLGILYYLNNNALTKGRSALTFNSLRPVHVREYIDDIDFAGYANPDRIVLSKNPPMSPDEILVHEGTHWDQYFGDNLPINLMHKPDIEDLIKSAKTGILNEPKYRFTLLNILDDAYLFTEDYSKGIVEAFEKGATNRLMRYNIWLNTNKPSPKELDNIIDNMSDDDIIYMLTQTNGYSINFHKHILETGRNKKEAASAIRRALKKVPMVATPVAAYKMLNQESNFNTDENTRYN